MHLGRELTKEDIDKLIPNKSEDDIFHLDRIYLCEKG